MFHLKTVTIRTLIYGVVSAMQSKIFGEHTTAGEVTNLAQAYMVDAGREMACYILRLEM